MDGVISVQQRCFCPPGAMCKPCEQGIEIANQVGKTPGIWIRVHDATPFTQGKRFRVAFNACTRGGRVIAGYKPL
ncbi:MAG: hypothetical protein U0271_43820 [Polyangiaceae bacterium]